jgi:hypothetical protein
MMAGQEPEEEGRKGGAAEHHLGAHYYQEAAIPADETMPATRIKWGPVFAGYVVALATALLWFALGMAIGLRPAGLAVWSVVFGAVGVFLGTVMAARTAGIGTLPAMLHGVVIWALFMFTDVLTFGGAVRDTVMSAVGMFGGTPAAPAAASIAAARLLGWWFFGSYICLLIAAVLGGAVGAVSSERTGRAEPQ